MGQPSEQEIIAEVAAGKAGSAKALPRLRTQRDDLEREAGALGVAKRNRLMLLLVVAGAAGVLGLYALWTTVRGEPSVAALVGAAALGICAAAMYSRASRMNGARARHLEALHAKMLAVGRRIDRAERNLRD